MKREHEAYTIQTPDEIQKPGLDFWQRLMHHLIELTGANPTRFGLAHFLKAQLLICLNRNQIVRPNTKTLDLPAVGSAFIVKTIHQQV